VSGLLVFFIPFFDICYGIKNSDVAGRALILRYVGSFIAVTALIAGPGPNGFNKMLEPLKLDQIGVAK
jgi:hypothetical protein